MFSAGQGPESLSTSTKWSRPELPPIDAKKDEIVFQQLEVDYYTGTRLISTNSTFPPGSQCIA